MGWSQFAIAAVEVCYKLTFETYYLSWSAHVNEMNAVQWKAVNVVVQWAQAFLGNTVHYNTTKETLEGVYAGESDWIAQVFKGELFVVSLIWLCSLGILRNNFFYVHILKLWTVVMMEKPCRCWNLYSLLHLM